MGIQISFKNPFRHRGTLEGCLAKPNVVGYSQQPCCRIQGGRELPNTKVVRIYVSKKVPAEQLKKRDMLPTLIEPRTIAPDLLELETDVVEIGSLAVTPPIPDPKTGRHGALLGGISVGHKDSTAGTLGRMVFFDGQPHMLSNNHVLAQVSLEGDPKAQVGDEVMQPGPYDSPPAPENLAARLAEWVPLKKDGPNRVDAAIARIVPPRQFYRDVQLLMQAPRSPLELKDPIAGMAVEKSGRTTGLTSGIVLDPAATVKVTYGPGLDLIFEDQMLLHSNGQAISYPGDSGSLIVHHGADGKDYSVGLLFAGSDKVTIANRMSDVVAAFSKPLSLDGPFFGDAPGVAPPPPAPKKRYGGSQTTLVVEVVGGLVGSHIEASAPAQVQIGETFKVKGKLVDSATGEGLPSRSLTVESMTIQTDQNGAFELDWGPLGTPGNQLILLRFEGD